MTHDQGRLAIAAVPAASHTPCSFSEHDRAENQEVRARSRHLRPWYVVSLARAQSDPLPSWNDGPAKATIIEFVAKVTKEGSPDFVPPAERIAVFDNDGTLWAEQPMYFQLSLSENHLRLRLQAYNHSTLLCLNSQGMSPHTSEPSDAARPDACSSCVPVGRRIHGPAARAPSWIVSARPMRSCGGGSSGS